MKILHILDHSIPLHSGYTFRTRAILDQQRKMGWKSAHITSTKHVAKSPYKETVDGLHFYRTHGSGGFLGKLPLLNQYKVVSTLSKHLDQVIEIEKPDILHAYSPSLNGMAVIFLLILALLPTFIHSYLGSMYYVGRTVNSIPTVLAKFSSEPFLHHKDPRVESMFDSLDWIERTYKDDKGEKNKTFFSSFP